MGSTDLGETAVRPLQLLIPHTGENGPLLSARRIHHRDQAHRQGRELPGSPDTLSQSPG